MTTSDKISKWLKKLDDALAKNKPMTLPAVRNWPGTPHLLDAPSVWAVKMALATDRPLLLRGDPGTGKSQLARAAASVLGWTFLSRVINARCEPEDLLFRFDAVARLAASQISRSKEETKEALESTNFLLPEILWWALNPEKAQEQFTKARPHCGDVGCLYANDTLVPWNESEGTVVLIDEIDKAESEVPNSLLEVLSSDGFDLPYGAELVVAGERKRLIIITTNEDREMPAAFLRRCLVHRMDLPKDEQDFRGYLSARAELHLNHKELNLETDSVEHAITLLWEERTRAADRDLPMPGQSELLDLLVGVATFCKTGAGEQKRLIDDLTRYTFDKSRL
jgi:MoxR-like ATPase